MFNFSYCSAESKYYGDSNKLLFGKLEDETGGIAIEEFVGLKPKIYSFLVNDSSKDKKVVVTILSGKYKVFSFSVNVFPIQ